MYSIISSLPHCNIMSMIIDIAIYIAHVVLTIYGCTCFFIGFSFDGFILIIIKCILVCHICYIMCLTNLL